MDNCVKIDYLGQCGFALSSDKIRIVTDPYLSYSVDNAHYSEETPWRRLYPPPCTLDHLKPDCVVISHEHDDHLDPDTVKEYLLAGGDAFFVAPAPICHMLEELGVHCERIIPAHADTEILLSGCRILPIPCAHTELHTDENGDFFELSYILDFGEATLFFGGDMSLREGLIERLEREKPDLLLLPCNGRDEERDRKGIVGNINEREAASLAAALGVPFIPMHHDLYEINSCPEEWIISAAAETGARIILPKLIR